MSEPTTTDPDPIHGALHELLAATSSLRMHPNPMPDQGIDGFLVDTDAWAQHAQEHINAAIEYLRRAPRQ
jgi:hypothetical protein